MSDFGNVFLLLKIVNIGDKRSILCMCVSTPIPVYLPNATFSIMKAIFGSTSDIDLIISSAVGGEIAVVFIDCLSYLLLIL